VNRALVCLALLAAACAPPPPVRPDASLPVSPPSARQTPDAPFRASAPLAEKVPLFAPGHVRSFSLTGGARVFAYARAGELTSIRISFAVPPSATVVQRRTILPLLVFTMMTESDSFPMPQLRERLLVANAILAGDADADRVTVELVCPNESVAAGLEPLADVVLHPSLTPSQVEFRRSRRAVSIEGRRMRPREALSLAHDALLFGPTHPYGSAAGEHASDVRGVTREDLVAALTGLRDAGRVTISVAGGYDDVALRPALEELFGSLKGGGAPSPDEPTVPHSSAKHFVLVDRPHATTARVQIGGALPALTGEPDYTGIVLEQIMGSRTVGRLHDSIVVDRALTDDVSTSFVNRTAGSKVTVTAEGPSKRAAELVSALESAIAALVRDGVQDDELGAAKDRIVWAHAGSFERVSNITWALMILAERGEDPEVRLRDFARHVQSVTAAQVRDLAERFFAPDRRKIVLLGDAAELREQLARAGYVPDEVQEATAVP
jgi:zinc protease